jgi:hypothetical protein
MNGASLISGVMKRVTWLVAQQQDVHHPARTLVSTAAAIQFRALVSRRQTGWAADLLATGNGNG